MIGDRDAGWRAAAASFAGRHERARGDDGVVLVLNVFFLLALVISAALVVDIGAQRYAKRDSQNLADFAALAAGEKLSIPQGIDSIGACRDAVTTLKFNRPSIASTISVPCGDLPADCVDGTTPVTVTDGGTAAPLRVSIRYPVADIELLDDTVEGLRLHDDKPCTRMRVTVSRTVPTMFAAAMGPKSLSTTATAVVHRDYSRTLKSPSLWMLDPTGCTALSVQGGSSVRVGRADLGGVIAIDSDGSDCANNATTIDAGGTGTEIFAVPTSGDIHGTISLNAMLAGQTDCSTGNLNACDPADAGTLIQPQPERRGYRATRSPVDRRFNCKSSYPLYHGIEIAGCPEAGVRPAFVDQVRTAIGQSGTPAGFTRWTAAGYSCNSPPAMTVVGNWYIDCSTFKLTSGSDIVFRGGNVVFDGAISMSGGMIDVNGNNDTSHLSYACLNTMAGSCTSQSGAGAAFIYMRNGSIKLTGGSINLQRTALIQDGGEVEVAGGAPPTWTAPTEGPFRGLALWSEKASTRFRINGGASMSLGGVFFTPEADAFQISGGSPVTPQRAQFVSYRLAVTGGAQLDLSPDEVEMVTLPPPAPRLIR